MENVLVTIPTYNNNGKISALLESLKCQSYPHFDVLIILKPSIPSIDRILFNILDQYPSLHISVKKQRFGFFDEAMNIAFSDTAHDIIINTDDDAIVSRNWVQDHVNLHLRYPNIGIATGNVIERTNSKISDYLNTQKWRLNKHTLLDTPIDKKFLGYAMYPGKSGMLVDTGKRGNLIKTLKLRGVNMSWKPSTLGRFKLLCYTLRGTHNESAAGVKIIQHGFDAVYFNGAHVNHNFHESLSRGGAILSYPSLLSAESVLFSYNMANSYKIDLRILNYRTIIDNFIVKALTFNRNFGYKYGFSLAKYAIKNNLSPKLIRNELLKLVR